MQGKNVRRRGTGRRQLALACALGTLCSVIPVVGQELTYNGALAYGRGDYVFSEPTATFSLSNGLTWSWEGFRLSVAVPAILQDSRAITVVGSAVLPTGGPDHGAVARRAPGEPVPMGRGRRGGGGAGGAEAPDTVEAPGDARLTLGDPLVSASLELHSGFGTLRSVDVLFSFKPPLASLEDGVGTGEWDVGGGLGAAVGVGRALVMVDAAWWRYGDLPELELEDGFSYSLGLGVPLTGRTSILAGLWGANTIIEGVDPPVSVSAMLSRRGSEGRSLFVGGSAGLTESTATFTLSLGARMRLWGGP